MALSRQFVHVLGRHVHHCVVLYEKISFLFRSSHWLAFNKPTAVSVLLRTWPPVGKHVHKQHTNTFLTKLDSVANQYM